MSIYTQRRNGNAYTAVGFRKIGPKNYVSAMTLGSVRPRRAYRRNPYRSYQVTRGYPRGTRAELKSIDTAVTLAQDTTGTVQLLNGCERGDDLNQRDGRQITLKYIDMRLVTKATTTTGIDQFHRFICVYDKQANGVAPALTDVLDTASYVSQLNLNNRNRFVVLFDRTYSINASGESGSNRLVNARCNLRNKLVTFNSGTAGTVADISTGSIYIFSIGSIVAGANAGSSNGTARVRFTDK